jgi:DNA-binding CsgD family transcriptional regulator
MGSHGDNVRMEWERPLDLLEAAYRLDGTDEEWTDGLVQTMSAVVRREGIGAGGFWLDGRIDKEGRTVIGGIRLPRVVNPSEDGRRLAEEAMRGYPFLPAELQQKIFFSSATVGTASAITGQGNAVGDDPSWTKSGLDVVEARDAFGMVCHEGPLNAFVLSSPLPRITVLPQSEVRLWERLASHVGAGFRLRRSPGPRLERADAVLSRSGKVHHLAAVNDLGAVKDGFARRRDARARGTKPETALEIWQGLHDGRWSLVDYVDTDRKAFVLAVRNEPARDVASALTDRQRAAVALASLGYANKQIAYALGLSASAVAMLLARARAVIGVRTRAELVRAFKRDLASPAQQVQ